MLTRGCAMTLSDEDQADIFNACHRYNISEALGTYIFNLGKLSGRAEAIAEAARVCEAQQINRPDDPLANTFDGAARTCAKLIRALA